MFSFHRQLIAFTLCGAPDAPPTVEILKVVSNGLLLSWLPPKRDNGMQILLYEVEIIDFGELQRQGMDEESLAAGSLPLLKSRKSLKAGGASSAKDSVFSDDDDVFTAGLASSAARLGAIRARALLDLERWDESWARSAAPLFA